MFGKASSGPGNVLSRGASGRSSLRAYRGRKAFAVLAVAIMLAVCVVPMLPFGGSPAHAATGTTHTVVYHPYGAEAPVYSNTFNEGPDGSYGTVSVTYYGSIVSTEYNPQVWAGTFKDSSGRDAVNWYPITPTGYTASGEGSTLVFTGWVYGVYDGGSLTGYSDFRYPGEVLSEAEIAKATGSDNCIHVYATWGKAVNIVDSMRDVRNSGWKTGGNEFTNIVYLGGKTKNTEFLGDNAQPTGNHDGFTVRGGEATVSTRKALTDLSGDNSYVMWSNVIMDNITLYGTSPIVDHGDYGGGIFANRYVLIIGTGVGNGNDAPGASLSSYIQVFGGNRNGAELGRDKTLRDAYGDGTEEALNMSTMVIIHSGKWSNVVGGCPANGRGTYNCSYVSVREAEVLDSLVGGNAGYWDLGTGGAGSTYVYATGLTMRGDDYEERMMDPGFDDYPRLTKPSLLVGGNNNGAVRGDTHVFISGDSSVWDVCGAGRRGGSSVINSNVEVSGNARVNHILCGSVADGIHNLPTKTAVTKTTLTVRDNAAVASLFGAGYDMYSSPTYPSMYGSGCSVNVNVTGGTVGYVYGGGYRGNLGYQSDPVDAVNIEISGGKVLGDVFGGGRGGLDKVNHGTSAWPPAISDSTGKSAVFAKAVNVTVSGGEVMGSVYGGGESTPQIQYSLAPTVTTQPVRITDKPVGSTAAEIPGMSVASVKTYDLNVSVSGGKVHGNVCGGGKGVDVDDTVEIDGVVYHSTAFIFTLIEDNGVYSIGRIPWLEGEKKVTVIDNGGYGDMASVSSLPSNGSQSDLSITVSVDEGAEVGKNVYGGGLLGRVGPSVSLGSGGPTDIVGVESGDTAEVNLGKCTVLGSVFGGGLGRTDVLSTNLNGREVVINGAVIQGGVYGGSRLGDDNCYLIQVGGMRELITDGFRKGTAEIRFISGRVDPETAGNIYGGGYRGHSYMNSNVLVGVPAWPEGFSKTDLAVDYLTAESVFGGASVGDSPDFSQSELLLGDARVELGNWIGSENQYREFSVSGNVFGEGDNCGISGKSEINFIGFEQESDLLSVQKADNVLIQGSVVKPVGATDASSPDLTSMVSVNRVGTLTLKKGDTGSLNGLAVLDVGSTVSRISGFESLEKDGSTKQPVDGGGTLQLNIIYLRSGAMFSVLGEDNSGTGTSLNGYTLVLNGGDTYYGCVVASGKEDVIRAGFYTATNVSSEQTKYTPLERQDMMFMDNEVWMWTLSGVFSVKNVVELHDDAQGTEGSISVSVPKFVSSSTLEFAGGYVIPDAPGSMSLVKDYTEDIPGKQFKMKVGNKAGPGYLYFGTNGEGKDIVSPIPSDLEKMNGSGIMIGMTVSTKTGFETSGFAGKVILHFVEILNQIPINVFDVEVSVYLFPSVGAGTGAMHVDVVVYGDGNGNYTGTADAYLPILSNNGIAHYDLSAKTLPASVNLLTVDTVSNNLNNNGWKEHPISGKVPIESNSSTFLGTGGVTNPVVRFEISCTQELLNGWVNLDLGIVPETLNALVGGNYTLKLHILEAEIYSVVFHDKYFDTTKTDWSVYQQILTIKVPFGTVPNDIYVAVKNNYSVGWTYDAKGYMDAVAKSLKDNDGSVLFKDTETFLYGPKVTVVEKLNNDTNYEVIRLEEFLTLYVENKPDTDYGDGETLDYSGWSMLYDSDKCLSRFNFVSKIAENLSVYAGYVVSIKIIPFIDVSNPGTWDDPLRPYSVIPNWLQIGNPGIIVNLDKFVESMEVSPGYKIVDTNRWYTLVNGELKQLASSEIPIRSDVEVYVMLELVYYEIKVNVNDSDLTTIKINGVDDQKVTLGTAVTVTFNYDYTEHFFGFTPKDTHSGEVIRNVTIGYVLGSNGDRTLTFRMPAHDMTIYVESSKMTLVEVQLSVEGNYFAFTDNVSFGLSQVSGVDISQVKIIGNNGAPLRSLQFYTAQNSISFPLDTQTTGFPTGYHSIKVWGYVGDQPYTNESGTLSIDISNATDFQVTVEIYIQVMYVIDLQGSDYHATVERVTDPRSTTVAFDMEGSDVKKYDAPTKIYVSRGDRLYVSGNGVATTEWEAYKLFDLDSKEGSADPFNLMDVSVDTDIKGGDRLYAVSGGTDDYLRNPVFGIRLNFEVRFTADGNTVMYEEGKYPVGYMGADGAGKRAMVWSPVKGDNDELVLRSNPTGTNSYIRTGDWTFTPAYIAFDSVAVNKTFTVKDHGTTVEFTVDAMIYDLYVKSPGMNDHVWKMKWNISMPTTVRDASGADAERWSLSYTVGGPASSLTTDSIIRGGLVDLYDLVNGSTLRVAGNTNTLYLTGVTDGKTIVIVTTEGSLNGGHEVNNIWLPKWTENPEIDGTTVTVSYAPASGGTAATVTLSGFPDGTGSLEFRFAIGDTPVTVVIYVFPVLEDLGPLL